MNACAQGRQIIQKTIAESLDLNDDRTLPRVLRKYVERHLTQSSEGQQEGIFSKTTLNSQNFYTL